MNPKPLKLALIRQRYSAFGGAERFVARAMQALQAQGAAVSLITRQWQANSDDALVCDPFFLGNIWRDWSFARCVCRTLQRHRFDLVQSHERLACCDIYRAGDGVHAEWLKQRARSLRWWQRVGVALNPYHHYTLAAEKKLFASPRLRAVICNSRMVQEEIQTYFHLPKAQLPLIYSGVDLESFHPGLREVHRHAIRAQLNVASEATLFLFLGSGFARKGLAILLRALSALPQAYLAVVGQDKHALRYQTLARHLGIAARVHFLGPQSAVHAYYGAADALVLPTLYDPFPNVALEALACGLPIITSTKSGAAELITTGLNGYVCDALDQAALQAAMQALTPERAYAMRVAARDSVAHLSLEAMAERLTVLYQTLLD